MIGDSGCEAISADGLLAALSGISFDLLLVYEHARDDNDERLAYARLAIDSKGNEVVSSQRWQPVAAAANDWMRSEHAWLDAIDRIDSSQLTTGDHQTIDLLKSRKIRSVMALPLIGDDRIIASILVCSRKRAAYRQPELARLRDNGIQPLLQKMLDCIRERRVKLLSEIRKQFKVDLTPEALAEKLVRILAEENDWDFVGIYRVEDEFAMVASCDRTPERSLQVNQDYRQPLHVGMLGSTLKAGRCLRADDVTVEPPPYGYMAIDGFNARSALCYPIRVAGNIEWILDCSSTAYAAFRGPDRQVLDELVDGLQSTLGLWFETRLSHAILDGLTEPVLVADRRGIVRRANSAACNLFGWASEENGRNRPLLELAADAATSEKLRVLGAMQGEELRFKTALEPRVMLATSKLSSETLGHYVLKLSTKGEQQWLAGLEFARTALETEVGQSRAILMLAGALLDRMRGTLQETPSLKGADETVERVMGLLGQADLNYDKMAGALLGRGNSALGELVRELRSKSSDAVPATAPFGAGDLSRLLQSVADRAVVSLLAPRATDTMEG